MPWSKGHITGHVLGKPGAPLSVMQVNQQIKGALESKFERVWLLGEVSNCICHRSGHYYFSLKDAHAQINCVLFQQHSMSLATKPKNGMQLVVCGKCTLYPARGQFQLQVYQCLEAGAGQLQAAFNLLKSKLLKAGFFDQAHKKLIPKMPRSIGLITSLDGAALQDILAVISKRFACVQVIIYPSIVQGAAAVQSLVSAIHTADQRQECDVLILARGGGSLEDLWPFNEEAVVKAIYHCTLPTISGVGHETDITLCDFAADQRAATPSAAAAMAVPDAAALCVQIDQWSLRMQHCVRQVLNMHYQAIEYFASRQFSLAHPMRLGRQTIVQQRSHMRQAMHWAVQQNHAAYQKQCQRLLSLRIESICMQGLTQLHQLQMRLAYNMKAQLVQAMQNGQVLAQRLASLNPDKVLLRGYALVLGAAKMQDLVIRSHLVWARPLAYLHNKG